MEDNGSLTWTLAVDAATVERAKATGQPQITVPREITALATQVPGGLPRKDYAPPSVYVSGGEVQLEHNDRLNQDQWFGYDGYLGYRDKMVREWPILQAGKLAWSLSTLSRQWRIDPPKGGDSRDLMIAEFTRIENGGRSGPFWSIRGIREERRPKWILFEETEPGTWKISGI